MVGGRQRGKSREKGRRVGVPAKVERGRVPSENSLPCPSSTNDRHPTPSCSSHATVPHHRALALFPPSGIASLPARRRPLPPSHPLSFSLALSLPPSPSLSQPSTQYTSRMTRITSQRRERATCSPRSPSLPLSPLLPPGKVPIALRPQIRLPRDSLAAPRRGTPCTHDICDALYIHSAIAAGTRRDRGEAVSLRWYTELRACSFPVHHVRALVAQAERRKTDARRKRIEREERRARERERERKQLRSRALDRPIRARDRGVYAYTRVAELRDHV